MGNKKLFTIELQPYLNYFPFRFRLRTSFGEWIAGESPALILDREVRGVVTGIKLHTASVTLLDQWGHPIGKENRTRDIPIHYTPLLLEDRNGASLNLRGGREIITLYFYEWVEI